MARIGSLFVNLALEDASFINGLKRATKQHEDSMRKMGRAADLARNAMKGFMAGIAAELSVGAVANLAKGLAQTGADIERFAQLANATPQSFQRWAAATQTVGISQEKLADVLKDVNDKFGDFMATGKGPLADFFENIAPKVGVTADQFARLGGPEALQLYASSLEKAGVNQQQMTFYMEALAHDATLLAPLLKANGEEMQRLGDRAADAGAIMGDQSLTAARDLKVAMDDMGAAWKGATLALGDSGLTLLLRDVAVWMNEVVRASGPFMKFMRGGFDELRGFNSVRKESGLWTALNMTPEETRAAGRTKRMMDELWRSTVAFGKAAPQNPVAGLAGATAKTAGAGAASKAATGADKAAAEYQRFMENFRRLEEEYQPGLRARRAFEENLAAIERAAKSGLIDSAGAAQLRQKAREQFEELAPEAADGFTKTFRDSMKNSLGDGVVGWDMGGLLESAVSASADLAEHLNKPFREAAAFGEKISADLAQGVIYGKNIGDALVNSFKAAAAEAVAGGLFKLMFGGGTADNSGLFGAALSGLGKIFGGARADGGPVSAGRAYLVGERGPELIVPPSAGTVIPNHALGGGTTIHVDARGATDPAAVEQAALAAFMAARSYTDGAFAGAARPRLRRSWGA